jgi:hypothetical protein
MILVIDNYDSFTYNLVQYLGELKASLEVRRNDQVSIDQMCFFTFHFHFQQRTECNQFPAACHQKVWF